MFIKNRKSIIIDGKNSGDYKIAILDDSGDIDAIYFESSTKKSLKSNIYLGKVIRVEHSLQAAFISYGGDKNGFLPLSEIHPDYYQIPAADKKKLMQTMQMQAQEESAHNDDDSASDSDSAEKNPFGTRYGIQEVIKRGQNLLVQVYRDERGNKGVSLTTYVSLAGRYCILMPNSHKPHGVSKKISDHDQRSRLKTLMESFGAPEGVSIVVRTAGIDASDNEIYDDFVFLTKEWNNIRSVALKSKVPATIYQEEGIIKQIMRDEYQNNIQEIIVDGKDAYHKIIDVANGIVPSATPKISLYKENVPLFTRYNINDKIEALYDSTVHLKSGGSIVINHTEALTAIDVNSGKATTERDIEDTALRTNLEAAVEVAKQLRLRDLGGLIVIDFIDMRNYRNREAVEQEMANSIMKDSSKIQFIPIGPFGLMEISRQRLRNSFVESSMSQCPHCLGSGYIKLTGVTANDIICMLKDKISDNISSKTIDVCCSEDVKKKLLTEHKLLIASVEKKSGVKIIVNVHNKAASYYKISYKVEDKETVVYETLDRQPTKSYDNRIDHRSSSRQNNNRKKFGNKKKRYNSSTKSDKFGNKNSTTKSSILGFIIKSIFGKKKHE